MARVTSSVARNKRKKKVLKQARGQFGARSKLYRTAKNAVERGWAYSYRDRRRRKRDFRRLWIARINAASREHDLSYSRFISGSQERWSGSEPESAGRSRDSRAGGLR